MWSGALVIPFDQVPPLSEQNIVLTGFMGVGKTTVGKCIAELLARDFIDTDNILVMRAGKSISKIFAEDGEAHFRALERELAHELADKNGLVISTGGGMLVDATNRAAFLARSFVVCLDGTPELIQQRLANSKDRPLAANWREVFEKRREIYAQIPVHVSVERNTPEQTAKEIIELWRSKF